MSDRCSLRVGVHANTRGRSRLRLVAVEEGRGATAVNDPRALAREALAHVDALYNHARRLVRDPSEADELVPRPEPIAPGAVVVKIRSCGICQTDYKAIRGIRRNVTFPLIHDAIEVMARPDRNKVTIQP